MQARDDPGAGERPGHATRLLGSPRELLERTGLDWRRPRAPRVGVGPGNVHRPAHGVASARGLAQSLYSSWWACRACRRSRSGAAARLKARRAMRRTAQARAARNPRCASRGGIRGGLCQRGRASSSHHGLSRPSASGRFWMKRAPVPGAPDSWLAVGDGALRFADQLARRTVEPPDQARLCIGWTPPRSAISGHAGNGRGARVGLPDYRRRPDAELAL